MSCNVSLPCRRSVLIALIPLLVLYGLAFHALITPLGDEAYRRTFVTGEFGTYPLAVQFNGKNALDVATGEKIDLLSERGRLLLGRFDWRKFDPDTPYLVSTEGSIFLHRPEEDEARLGLTLHLTIACGMVDYRMLELLHQGQPVWHGRCEGPKTVISVPLRSSGDKSGYHQITLRRLGLPLSEHWAMRIGLRYRDLAVLDMQIGAPQ